MKQLISLAILLCSSLILFSQKYPTPEFSNEVYYLKKDSVNMVLRLEKNATKMDNKTKMGGFGGSESGYSMDGERSKIRLRNGNGLSFVYSTGAAEAPARSAQQDSMMRANGMDPTMMEGMNNQSHMGTNDPANNITLYKMEAGKGKRTIVTMKVGGMGIGNKKPSSSDKFTFSVKKVREGYWELVVDKTLPKGEYAFSIMNMTGSMDGSTICYTFGID